MTDRTSIAVVTGSGSGSGSGIGAAVAAELLLRGWMVGGLDRQPSPACSLSAEVVRFART